MRNMIKKFWWVSLLLLFLAACGGNDTNSSDTNEQDDASTESEENQESQEGEAQVSGGELHIAYSAQPATNDPHLTTAVATSDIMRNVYETLITIDEDHQFQPMLAESYNISEDGTEITFHLRQGVLFHNGKEMTSEDVVASMKRWQELSSMGRAQFADATFEATDDYTVVLTLPQPLSTALSVLSANMGAFPAIMPKEVAEAATETGVEEYIGTGPFEFTEWKQDVHILLTKFADYQSRDEEPSGLAGSKEALVDKIYFKFVTDSSTRVAGLLSGEYDMAHAVPWDNLEQLEASSDVVNHIVPGSTQVLTFNKKKGIFTDLKAREAVLAALSMEDIMQGAFGNAAFYTLNHNLVMPHLEGLFYSDYGKDKYNQDQPEKGAQLLEEAGYVGEEIVLLSTRDYEEVYNASVIVQQRLEEIGLKVKLDVVDWATFLEKKEDENAFDINIVGFGPQPEPTSYLFLMKGPHSGWTDDDEFHDLVAEFRSQPTLEDTKEVYDEIMKWVADHVPFIKIADYNRIFSTRDSVQNFRFVDGPILWNVSKTE